MALSFPNGLKVSYSGDCRPSSGFARIGRDSTVLIHEATFDDEMRGDAEAKKHSTTSEAIGVGLAMRARRVVLTHFSQRYQKIPVMDNLETDKIELEDAEDEELDEPMLDAQAAVIPADSSSGDTPMDETSVGANPRAQTIVQRVGSMTEVSESSSPKTAWKPVVPTAPDMKICVAFDYMKVKVGEIEHMEKLTPALLELYQSRDIDDKIFGPNAGLKYASVGKKAQALKKSNEEINRGKKKNEKQRHVRADVEAPAANARIASLERSDKLQAETLADLGAKTLEAKGLVAAPQGTDPAQTGMSDDLEVELLEAKSPDEVGRRTGTSNRDQPVKRSSTDASIDDDAAVKVRKVLDRLESDCDKPQENGTAHEHTPAGPASSSRGLADPEHTSGRPCSDERKQKAADKNYDQQAKLHTPSQDPPSLRRYRTAKHHHETESRLPEDATDTVPTPPRRLFDQRKGIALSTNTGSPPRVINRGQKGQLRLIPSWPSKFYLPCHPLRSPDVLSTLPRTPISSNITNSVANDASQVCNSSTLESAPDGPLPVPRSSAGQMHESKDPAKLSLEDIDRPYRTHLSGWHDADPTF